MRLHRQLIVSIDSSFTVLDSSLHLIKTFNGVIKYNNTNSDNHKLQSTTCMLHLHVTEA